VTTFNMLCPLFRRLQGEERESSFPAIYNERQQEILKLLQSCGSDIICLQEFWVNNEEIVKMYRDKLGSKYQWMQLSRTGGRGDGLVTLVKHEIELLDQQDIIFHDFGDRVAMLARMKLSSSSCQRCQHLPRPEIILINTHLLFPHQPYFDIVRMRELRKILGFLELYKHIRCQGFTHPSSILLCGDFNGYPNDVQYKYLRQLNFSASCAHDSRWVTHRNHKDELLCSDFVWLLNPRDHQGPLDANWQDMVFRSTCQRVASQTCMLGARRVAHDQDGEEGARDESSVLYDASRHEWRMNSEYFRLALNNLGFEEVASGLSDAQIRNLLAGPDRLYVDNDALLHEADVFKLFDLDKDGKIDEKEFTAICGSLQVLETSDMIRQVFKHLDANSTGYIDSEVFARWWKDEVNQIFTGTERAEGFKSMYPAEGMEEKQGSDLRLVEAKIHPSILESGEWDPSFNLSDHGMVTCKYWLPPFELESNSSFSSALEYRAAVNYLQEAELQP